MVNAVVKQNSTAASLSISLSETEHRMLIVTSYEWVVCELFADWNSCIAHTDNINQAR